jgi:hypothetical protein
VKSTSRRLTGANNGDTGTLYPPPGSTTPRMSTRCSPALFSHRGVDLCGQLAGPVNLFRTVHG